MTMPSPFPTGSLPAGVELTQLSSESRRRAAREGPVGGPGKGAEMGVSGGREAGKAAQHEGPEKGQLQTVFHSRSKAALSSSWQKWSQGGRMPMDVPGWISCLNSWWLSLTSPSSLTLSLLLLSPFGLHGQRLPLLGQQS